jgi:DNA-directed RNA polymerase sigma subunit (sigma70/sigma32)
MKVNVDLKAGFLESLKREVLATLTPEERAVIEVSTGEMGNKPDAVKLGWLKMRTGDIWTKQRYTRALKKTMEKLKEAVAREATGKE